MNLPEWYAWGQQLTLVWFFILFIGIVAWVYWPGKQKKYDDAARKILETDTDEK